MLSCADAIYSQGTSYEPFRLPLKKIKKEISLLNSFLLLGTGLGSALQILQACIHSNSNLHELLSEVALFPQCLLNIPLQPGIDWRVHKEFQSRIVEIEKKLGSKGRVLIRESGTEPLLRIMVEAQEEETSKSSAAFLADSLSSM
jgi:phosphoglucosamine mutase